MDSKKDKGKDEGKKERMFYWHTEAPYDLPCPFCKSKKSKGWNLVRSVVTCLDCKNEIEIRRKF